MSIAPECPIASSRRAFTSVLLILTLTLITLAQDGSKPLHKVRLERGKVLTLSLVTPLDSSRSKVGDKVSLKLVRPVASQGAIVLPVGWIVQGEVTNVHRAGKNCHNGRVVWKPDLIKTPSGEQVRVQLMHSHLVAPSGGEPDHVPLDSPVEKVGRAIKYTAIAPVVIILSPFMILMLIGMSGEGGCQGEQGQEELRAPETRFVAAVSKNVRLTPLP